MAQEPGISVNVRFTADAIAAIDEYGVYLTRKRVARTSRSDVLRLALARLPIPHDATPELSAAMERIGAKPAAPPPPGSPVQEQLPSRPFNPQPKGSK